MKKIFSTLTLIVASLYINSLWAQNESSCQSPKKIKPMENWEIIAGNTALIKMSPTFSGSNLTYLVSSHPKNSKNKITINHQTGEISVVAEAKDNFNIKVAAKNTCGLAEDTFNVIIDEEE